MGFRIKLYFIEKRSIAQWAEKFSSQHRLKIDGLRSSVGKTNLKSKKPDDPATRHTVKGMAHKVYSNGAMGLGV